MPTDYSGHKIETVGFEILDCQMESLGAHQNLLMPARRKSPGALPLRSSV